MVNTEWNKLAPSRDEQREQKRMAVLRTGARLFAERGFDRTSLDDIAAALNVSKRTLYYYIENKNDILYESKRIASEYFVEFMAMSKDRDLPPLVRIEKILRAYAEWLSDEFGRCLVLADDSVLPEENRESLKASKKELDGVIRELIVEGVQDGSIAECDPKLATAAIFGAFNWIPQWKQAGDKQEYDEIADAFLNVLLNGLRVR